MNSIYYNTVKNIVINLYSNQFDDYFKGPVTDRNEVIRQMRLSKIIKDFCRLYNDKIFKCYYNDRSWVYEIDLSKYDFKVCVDRGKNEVTVETFRYILTYDDFEFTVKELKNQKFDLNDLNEDDIAHLLRILACCKEAAFMKTHQKRCFMKPVTDNDIKHRHTLADFIKDLEKHSFSSTCYVGYYGTECKKSNIRISFYELEHDNVPSWVTHIYFFEND